jgi:hypothetical protein
MTPFRIGFHGAPDSVRTQLRTALFACVAMVVLQMIPFSTAAAPRLMKAGWLTNAPAVYSAWRYQVTNRAPPPTLAFRPPSTNLPPEIRSALGTFLVQAITVLAWETNSAFEYYLPESLNHFILTNAMAHTNGRNMLVWSVRTHPPDWPARAPEVRWNPGSIMWGMKGLTGLSPCWEGEVASGMIPITALTRRHGYTRGHGMGPTGFRTLLTGKKIWFVTLDNQIIERRVLREVVRVGDPHYGDYTILLFDQDLPESISPVRVADNSNFDPRRSRLCWRPGAPVTIFQTEQSGYVSVGLPGFTVPTNKGGDSGSPNLLPMSDELVFFSGRTTSGVTPEMQADMDELCRLQGLDASRYQMQKVDLSRFPMYGDAGGKP